MSKGKTLKKQIYKSLKKTKKTNRGHKGGMDSPSKTPSNPLSTPPGSPRMSNDTSEIAPKTPDRPISIDKTELTPVSSIPSYKNVKTPTMRNKEADESIVGSEMYLPKIMPMLEAERDMQYGNVNPNPNSGRRSLWDPSIENHDTVSYLDPIAEDDKDFLEILGDLASGESGSNNLATIVEITTVSVPVVDSSGSDLGPIEMSMDTGRLSRRRSPQRKKVRFNE